MILSPAFAHTTYKKGRPSEGRHRYTMTALAAADNPAFLVSSMELAGKGYSYTADTVRKEVLIRGTFLEGLTLAIRN